MTSFSRADPFAEEVASEPFQDARGAFGASLGTGAPETLDELCDALLEAIVTAALGKGVALPSRQLVYMAPIPADCEQVAVLFTGWDVTPLQDTTSTTICRPWRWMANVSAIITRCTPAMPAKNNPLKTVPVARMNAASKMASDDSEIFLEVLQHIGEIGAGVTIIANPPQGGFQTAELNVSLISGGSFR